MIEIEKVPLFKTVVFCDSLILKEEILSPFGSYVYHQYGKFSRSDN